MYDNFKCLYKKVWKLIDGTTYILQRLKKQCALNFKMNMCKGMYVSCLEAIFFLVILRSFPLPSKERRKRMTEINSDISRNIYYYFDLIHLKENQSIQPDQINVFTLTIFLIGISPSKKKNCSGFDYKRC